MESVETPVKDGVLYQQHMKFGKKYWRKVWALLYAGGPSGVARLESWDVREGGLGPAGDRSTGPGRRGERRVIRLADCVSVLPVDGESCPRDTGAFLITTTERSHLLAAQHRQSWMGPICQLAFPLRNPQNESQIRMHALEKIKQMRRISSSKEETEGLSPDGS
ncbi:docking protein 3 [Sigmodon hispidus]